MQVFERSFSFDCSVRGDSVDLDELRRALAVSDHPATSMCVSLNVGVSEKRFASERRPAIKQPGSAHADLQKKVVRFVETGGSGVSAVVTCPCSDVSNRILLVRRRLLNVEAASFSDNNHLMPPEVVADDNVGPHRIFLTPPAPRTHTPGLIFSGRIRVSSSCDAIGSPCAPFFCLLLPLPARHTTLQRKCCAGTACRVRLLINIAVMLLLHRFYAQTHCAVTDGLVRGLPGSPVSTL